MGAVGARAVCDDLARHGHTVIELERGSTDTRLWKEVKRKRVRIPDLVCQTCGMRIESRAKTEAALSMSHSPTEEERCWDFGLVDGDYIAFPVCQAVEERYWSSGRLFLRRSYWHERNWVRWEPKDHINYVQVSAFRSAAHTRSSRKGVTEGSETSITWDATFSTRTGYVERVSQHKVSIRRAEDGHRHTWTIPAGQEILVRGGDSVSENQLIGSAATPVGARQLACGKELSKNHIDRLLRSRERTQRFTGVKLARIRKDSSFREQVSQLTADDEEDVYVRLEGASYLSSVCGLSARELFKPYCDSSDEQTRLEAVVAMHEAATDEAVDFLCEILEAADQPYFLRSAAAWSLSRVGRQAALARLVRAFADVDRGIREEALDGIVSIGRPALSFLLAGLEDANEGLAAGCAEALRRQRPLDEEAHRELTEQLRSGRATAWTVWLLGHLPRDQISTSIAGLQESAPELHYAISLLWSFTESWISRRWELQRGAEPEVPDAT